MSLTTSATTVSSSRTNSFWCRASTHRRMRRPCTARAISLRVSQWTMFSIRTSHSVTKWMTSKSITLTSRTRHRSVGWWKAPRRTWGSVIWRCWPRRPLWSNRWSKRMGSPYLQRCRMALTSQLFRWTSRWFRWSTGMEQRWSRTWYRCRVINWCSGCRTLILIPTRSIPSSRLSLRPSWGPSTPTFTSSYSRVILHRNWLVWAKPLKKSA